MLLLCDEYIFFMLFIQLELIFKLFQLKILWYLWYFPKCLSDIFIFATFVLTFWENNGGLYQISGPVTASTSCIIYDVFFFLFIYISSSCIKGN